MVKVKNIEVVYTTENHEDPLNQAKTVCVKISTNKGLFGDYVELPENASIEDAVTAINMLLAGCKDMTI